uniref:RNA-dependent RNA polymerase n=1 Tax=Panagrolaimus sp. ES5 TaxID=591445 RepID=A0AC34GUT8_9BILA
MFIDDKFFEFVILEPENYENIKKAIEGACKRHGKVKIRSALISKIVVDANDCIYEADLEAFIDYYPRLNKICKVHLQYPHDVLFPAEVECASEDVEVIKLDFGFLYNFKFMHTTTLMESEAVDHGMLDFAAAMAEMYGGRAVTYFPHTNWYHDQGLLRLRFDKEIGGKNGDIKLQFEYSSFLKIYVYQPKEEKKYGFYGNCYDGYMSGWWPESCIYSDHLTLTIAVGCPPIVMISLEDEPFSRAFDLPDETKYIEDEKFDDALAFLAAIHANLKLQPMMETVEIPRPITVNFGEDYIMMRTVIITPTRKICCPPMQLMSSRAFRILGGAEKFIQVKFRDENMGMMQRNEIMMKHVVLTPGLNGIVIAGRKFFDLARSNSMFREHGSYFYQTENENEIIQILKSLGNFKPEPSSKTAARVGQYFTSAKEVKHRLEPHEYAIIPDFFSITTNAKGEKYCFSDGVGLISLKFANSIKEQFNLAYLPSAFQIRCLGFKGVLSIDAEHPLLIDSGGDKLVLFRESQKKFDVSKSMEVVLGIVKTSAPALVRFNKPLINLWDQAARKQGLSTIFDKRVNELFSESLYHITSSLINNKRFNDALRKLPNYLNFQRTVRQVWINEPFFRSMVSAAALQQLKSLQYYKQISLPNELGRSMIGIVDVSGILKEGQVFVRYSKHVGGMNDNSEKIVCNGKVAVSRSPVYNIGDLRILEAVDIPQLHHFCDVIIFPNHGYRPHPDEMGGGDL